MVYYLIYRPSSNVVRKFSLGQERKKKLEPISVTKLMPRYHYSRITPDSSINNTETIVNARNNDESPIRTQTVLSSSNDENSYGPLKTTFVPSVNHNRSTTPKRREFISIPITREDGHSTTISNNSTRSVPVTYINETTNLLPTSTNQTNANSIHLLRPGSRYFQYHMNQRNGDGVTTVNVPSLPRLSSSSRRLSLTLPITVNKVVNGNSTNTDDHDMKKNSTITTSPSPSSNVRQIPIRLPQTTPVVSIPSTGSRVSSALYHAAPAVTPLQRQTADIGDDSPVSPPFNILSNSDFTVSPPIRSTETTRDHSQGSVRVQYQPRHRHQPTSNRYRSPSQSRRVIINLQNNQCVSLDSRLSAAMKPPIAPSTSPRSTQKNNLYYIPVLHEIQMPSDPTIDNFNSNNFKNEFHIEIPVTISKSTDQENRDDSRYDTDDGTMTRDPIYANNGNSTQTLKSILKRSSSRDTVARKNVSFMNA